MVHARDGAGDRPRGRLADGASPGGIGAAFLGHAITRVAIFITTGHSGLPKAKGTEDEEIERRHRTPEGWRILGPREASKDR